MTYSVYQHWDPLKVCIVGRSYPPEFYSWISVPHVRQLFEKIAIETEEDYQNLIRKLHSFGVKVLRPRLDNDPEPMGRKFLTPPMCPRDVCITIGNRFYYNFIDQYRYQDILDHIAEQGNQLVHRLHPMINGAMVSRIGKDLYFSVDSKLTKDKDEFCQTVNQEFQTTRNSFITTYGHGDGTYCPVTPGLIITLLDIPDYQKTFPGWETVYLPNQSWDRVQAFLKLKQRNRGRWWIPGFENDNDVIHVVEQWLSHWVGYVEETVFDVNMLVIDEKNVLVFNYNQKVFDALSRYGVTPHIVPFRHRYFWDGGLHCITSDLHREGTMKDYFPERTL